MNDRTNDGRSNESARNNSCIHSLAVVRNYCSLVMLVYGINLFSHASFHPRTNMKKDEICDIKDFIKN